MEQKCMMTDCFKIGNCCTDISCPCEDTPEKIIKKVLYLCANHFNCYNDISMFEGRYKAEIDAIHLKARQDQHNYARAILNEYQEKQDIKFRAEDKCCIWKKLNPILGIIKKYTNVYEHTVKPDNEHEYYLGTCPFCVSEKSLNMRIQPEKNIFWCANCRVGGDQISFICKMEKISPNEFIEKYCK